ncbi:iron-containing alcohol dehydrogenase [Boseongicola aestuarii]|uniref:Lactaldehyde reductase n=1 Tax=Boseongicola aestuarii TaxID=1470561 RepID=A0A238IZ42_9RHOB|nr:Lactaldehyde reductase [Boseongicola aestuarii]
MMSAVAMGATAFQKGLGGVHALSHPFGAIYHTYHGTMNAVCMPAVLQFSRPAIDGAIGQAAAYLGVSEEFDGSCAFVDDLIASLQIPPSLLGLGIEVPDIERIVSGALEDPSTGGNPVEITAENTREILLKIFCV